MREETTLERLLLLMQELGRTSPKRGAYHVYFVGGGTAVYLGWRQATIDVDLYSEGDTVFRDIQGIKERLNVNIEFARLEDFVPPLRGTSTRHLFIDKIGSVSFYHYDPYAQAFSKVVRGFERDLEDARAFVGRSLVDVRKFRSLVVGIPDSAYSRYPNLSRAAVEKAVGDFLEETDRSGGQS